MTKEELLLRELCLEVASHGIDSNRFTQLWIESGINLNSLEFEMANKILQQYEETSQIVDQQTTCH